MRMEDIGNLFDYESWGITTGEKGLGEVGVEVIRVAAYSPSLNGQREGDGAFGE